VVLRSASYASYFSHFCKIKSYSYLQICRFLQIAEKHSSKILASDTKGIFRKHFLVARHTFNISVGLFFSSWRFGDDQGSSGGVRSLHSRRGDAFSNRLWLSGGRWRWFRHPGGSKSGRGLSSGFFLESLELIEFCCGLRFREYCCRFWLRFRFRFGRRGGSCRRAAWWRSWGFRLF